MRDAVTVQLRRLWADGPQMPPGLRALDLLLIPAETAYRAAVSLRNTAYARGWLRSRRAPIPSISIGNLTVGGTGKTPLAAWLAADLRRRGHQPALLLRGYGDDEPDVHRALNPSIPVHVAARRVEGTRRAASAGADVVVLDDAFQHRALDADAQIVLLAVEDWGERRRLLPRGPWREPLDALRRADFLVVTRKTGDRAAITAIDEHVSAVAPGLPRAVARVQTSHLGRYDPATNGLVPLDRPPSTYRLGIAGVARPETVWAQLERLGVGVELRREFSDHHAYTAAEIASLVGSAGDGPVLATLKDAVKLGPGLPGGMELHVPVQEIVWEAGRESIRKLAESAVDRRSREAHR